MNGYKAFYNKRTADIFASSLYAAKLKAIETFNAPKTKRHMVSVVLCEIDSKQVTHTPSF